LGEVLDVGQVLINLNIRRSTIATFMAAKRFGGRPGQIFLGGPYLKFFSGNFFSQFAITFQGLYLNFSCQISVLSPKNPDILFFCAEIFNTQKRLGPNKKIPWAPSTSGPGEIRPCPPPPVGGPGNIDQDRASVLEHNKRGQDSGHF
jgi:hypothetical protein